MERSGIGIQTGYGEVCQGLGIYTWYHLVHLSEAQSVIIGIWDGSAVLTAGRYCSSCTPTRGMKYYGTLPTPSRDFTRYQPVHDEDWDATIQCLRDQFGHTDPNK
jgi:hypothetical protein